MPRRAYLYGLTNPLTTVETLHQALPDNLGEWIAAIASILTTIAALLGKRKPAKRDR